MGVKILSYIPPSAWAWRKSRAKSCTQIAGEFISIFPFELPIYQQAGAKISFLGNPLVDIAKPSLSKDSSRKLFNLEKEDRVVLLLPGSRSQEIKLILPAIIESARMISIIRPTRFFLLAAENIDQKIFQKKITASGVPIEIVKSAQRYDLMSVADAAIATSGTIVLEAALLNLPCVVLYKMSAINFFLAKLLVDTKFISLPNILANKKILIELIQNDVNPLRIVDETLKLYRDNKYRAQIVKDLNDACEKLGKPGAITRIVKKILEAAQS